MKNESGRSMLEMLGVLAIIGVLSVGAMAGYSKAMMQHKLNKNSEEISYLLATALFNSDKLNRASFNLLGELQALGGFTWHIEPYAPVWPGERYLSVTDSLGNQLWFEHYTKEEYPNIGDWFAMAVYLPQSDYISKVCYNYVNVGDDSMNSKTLNKIIIALIIVIAIITIILFSSGSSTDNAKLELLGSEKIVLHQYETYNEFGYKIVNQNSKGYRVEIEGKVDTSVMGTYNIVYNLYNKRS